MITVKFLGSAKKSFATSVLTLDKSNIALKDLIVHLYDIKPKDTPHLDISNVLIAVNGMDSSALQNHDTILKDNDIISIIPVIHGGQSTRVQFKVYSKLVELYQIKSLNSSNVDFLDNLRIQYPKLIIQAVSIKHILGISYVKKIIRLSLLAQKNNILLSKKFETDILMRFACTSQISQAIHCVGLEPKKQFLLISLGPQSQLDKLYTEIKSQLITPLKLPKNDSFLKKSFNITRKQINSVHSNCPLEDLLIEKAAILF